MPRPYTSCAQPPSAYRTRRVPSCLSSDHTLSFKFMATKRVEADIEAPRPTVREAMASVLAAAKVVAGAEGLDRQAAWAGPLHNPAGHPRARGLMLTRCFPIQRGLEAATHPAGWRGEGGV